MRRWSRAQSSCCSPRRASGCSICSAAWEISRCRSRAAARTSSASRATPGWSRARARNAELNGLDEHRVRLRRISREPSSGDAAGRGSHTTRCLLDPPRAGAIEVLPIVARCGAKVVLYISCHPGSLARDAGILVHEHGFTLRGRRRDGHVPAHCARRIGGTIHARVAATRHDTRSADDRRAGHDAHRRGSRPAAASAGRRGHPVHAQLREHRAARAPRRGHPRRAHAAAARDGRSRGRARAALSQGLHRAAADAHHRPRIRSRSGGRAAARAAVRLADGGGAARRRRST